MSKISCVEKIKSALSPHVHILTVTFNPPLLNIETEREPKLNDLNHYLLKDGYHLQSTDQNITPSKQAGLANYYPILLIFLYILGAALINNVAHYSINWQTIMNQFMAGFFLVFSAFKLLDIKGFAAGYATYDLLARHWYYYGYIYPFLELGLGILYLTETLPRATLYATIIIMGFSSLGVINSLYKKQKFQCACLGTFLKVPLSIITLIEDLMMVLLAALMLFVYIISADHL